LGRQEKSNWETIEEGTREKVEKITSRSKIFHIILNTVSQY